MKGAIKAIESMPQTTVGGAVPSLSETSIQSLYEKYAKFSDPSVVYTVHKDV